MGDATDLEERTPLYNSEKVLYNGDFNTSPTSPNPPAKSRINKTFRSVSLAYITLLISLVVLCISASSVQVLGGSIPDFELNMWRFIAQLVLVAPMIICKEKCNLTVPKAGWVHVAGATVTSCIFNLLYFLAAEYIPVGTLVGMMNAVTIITNAFFSICFKAERKLFLYLSAVVSVIGIFLLVQPAFFFANSGLYVAPATNWTSPCLDIQPLQFNSSVEEQALSDPVISSTALGYILVVISGVIMSIQLRFTAMSVRIVSPFTVTFYGGVLNSIILMILMFIFETPMLPGSPLCIGLLLAHCIAISQFLVVLPYVIQYISPAVFGVIKPLDMIIMLILQYTVMKPILPGKGNWVEILGGLICFIGCCVGPIGQLIVEKRNLTKQAKVGKV